MDVEVESKLGENDQVGRRMMAGKVMYEYQYRLPYVYIYRSTALHC